jgi:hypothetical protein
MVNVVAVAPERGTVSLRHWYVIGMPPLITAVRVTESAANT